MKKLVSFLICGIIMLSLFTFTSFAANQVVFTSKVEKSSDNSQVIWTVTLKEKSYVEAMMIKLPTNFEGLEYVSHEVLDFDEKFTICEDNKIDKSDEALKSYGVLISCATVTPVEEELAVAKVVYNVKDASKLDSFDPDVVVLEMVGTEPNGKAEDIKDLPYTTITPSGAEKNEIKAPYNQESVPGATSSPTEQSSNVTDADEGDNTVLIIVLVCVAAAVVIGGIAYLVVRSRKEK